MNEIQFFFRQLVTWHGRLDRIRFFFYVLVLAFAQALLITLAWGIFDPGFIISLILIVIIVGGGSVLSAFQAVKRFHDTGEKGNRVFFLLIPFVNIYFAVLLFFKKGESKKNSYGKAIKEPPFLEGKKAKK